ncbi:MULTISPECIES: RES family NAD+ phosphorylase [Undibacterium]|uniref:RES family NAD+ phosphorylase n=1 Tax=Undibacterium curvum TaxID=2762294 RepID=A0ABR7A9B0_9BURK|nr:MULTISPECIES: RES family NAD+ phosphorylase [Undibacterium]MBC3933461.1 RES family NAD+ phosphorylase [Undibacterium curvum]NDI83994.1 RES domain-containing protein [Undibacterium crateris]
MSAQLVWRIAKHTPQYRADDLSGGGAKAVGGRWNAKGSAVVYSASSIALATLETLVHLGDQIAIRNAFLVQITIPAKVWKEREVIEASELDPTWLAEPPGSASIDFGTQWLQGMSAPLLLVPSIIVPEEYNVLINPAHAAARQISATVKRQFIYDPRL